MAETPEPNLEGHDPSAPEPGLLGARRIRTLLDSHGIRLTRSLGQNFVIDPNTIRKMVEIAGVTSDDHVLEIGAGAGSLTVALAQEARAVTAIEIDRRLLPVLEATTGHQHNVTIVRADALQVDLASYGADVVVANLPYNIAATVVIEVLERCPTVRRVTVMTQREVAERLASAPGNKVYGQTTVLAAFHARAKVAGKVSRRAFFPVPNVDSSIVRLDRVAPPQVDHDLFKSIVKAAFSQRRKVVRNTVHPLLGDDPDRVFALAGVDPGSRPEELDTEAFASLARCATTIRAEGR